MKDQSLMTTNEFIFSILWRSVIGFFLYKYSVFRTLPQHDIYESLQILLFMQLISVFLFMIVLHHWKDGWTATASVLIPLGIYSIMTYRKTFPMLIRSILAILLILSIVYFVFLMMHRVNPKWKNRLYKVYISRLSRFLYFLACSSTICMLTIIMGIGWKSLFTTVSITSSVEPVGFEENTTKATIEGNREDISKLSPVIWRDLSTRQRLDILQTVCNIEVNNLGIESSVVVQGANLPSHTLGTYSHYSQRVIDISLDHLENDSVNEVLDTLFHEIYHCYEYTLADAYNTLDPEYQKLKLFQDAQLYLQESEHYVLPNDDLNAYFEQRLEIDSKIYAQEMVQKYYKYIEEYGMDNEQ